MAFKDTIFLESELQTEPQSFAFNAKVAAVFDDMICRSVPGYARIQALSAEIAAEILRADDKVYDLGCSTATSLIKIAQKLETARPGETNLANTLSLIGIDSSQDMVLRAQEKVAAFDFKNLISILQADIRSVNLKLCKLVICHYTLQFLAPQDRGLVANNIFNALDHEGVFIFSEKVVHSSALLQSTLSAEYDRFKLENGYSNLEIMRKRQALENVLIPLSLEENVTLLRSAGFRSVEILQKELGFVSFLACK